MRLNVTPNSHESTSRQCTAAMPHLPGADRNMLTSSIVSNRLKISVEARISPMVFCEKIRRERKVTRVAAKSEHKLECQLLLKDWHASSLQKASVDSDIFFWPVSQARTESTAA